MKNLILIAFLIFAVALQAQDSVIKKDGSELIVKVAEITDTSLKYTKEGLSVSFSLPLSEVLLVTFENGERMTFDVAKKADVEYILRAGTKFSIQMNETISSDKKGGRKVSTGEIITLSVKDDVRDMDGNVFVKAGTIINGVVTESVKRKAAGTKGKLSISADIVTAVDGQSVPITFKYSFQGKSKTALAVAGAAVVAAPLLLIKGKPAIIKNGTVFQALVSGDRKIDIEK